LQAESFLGKEPVKTVDCEAEGLEEILSAGSGRRSGQARGSAEAPLGSAPARL